MLFSPPLPGLFSSRRPLFPGQFSEKEVSIDPYIIGALVDANYKDIMKVVKGKWEDSTGTKKKGTSVKKKLGSK